MQAVLKQPLLGLRVKSRPDEDMYYALHLDISILYGFENVPGNKLVFLYMVWKHLWQKLFTITHENGLFILQINFSTMITQHTMTVTFRSQNRGAHTMAYNSQIQLLGCKVY